MMTFNPQNHAIGCVHLGPGAFHRAHQAVYTQEAMTQSGGDWRIMAISPRGSSVADALAAQKGRYTLVTQTHDGPQFQTIHAIAGALSAVRSPDQALDWMARPKTRLISLTVTEKAYHLSDDDNPLIRLLVRSLSRRHAYDVEQGRRGTAPVTLLSCDNLSGNGQVLRQAVMTYVKRSGNLALMEWINEYVRFPSTMVDRITPALTPDLVTTVSQKVGWHDQVPVETEDFRHWVIEDDFAAGRPDWDGAGALFVSDVAPYERMKLRLLNGSHSVLAYVGHLSGLMTVRDVMADPICAQLVSRYMAAAAGTLGPTQGLDLQTYRRDLLRRFQNPHIAHQTYQIAMDGSQKMPQRVFAPALDAIARQQDITLFAFATAVWIQYLTGKTETGVSYALRDPRTAELSCLPLYPEDRVKALFTLSDLVPPVLAAHIGFVKATCTFVDELTHKGVHATVRKLMHPLMTAP